MPDPETPRNKLLSSLPLDEWQRLGPQLHLVPLPMRRVLHYPRLPVEQVYFVETGLVSVVASPDPGGPAVEAWLIGPEGLAGLSAVLGVESSPHRRTVQAEGSAWRMSAADLRGAMEELPALRAALLRYVHAVLVQTAQLVACNTRHATDQRLARWLLMAHDRIGGNDLPLTHDVIARMLGVRRASVTAALKPLEQAGAIGTRRGLVRVVDRARLEAVSCPCYRVIAHGAQAVAHEGSE